jgi:hypothetical protein
MEDDPYLGWTSDHVGRLERLRDAVRILAEGHQKFRDRIDEATFALVHLDPMTFPFTCALVSNASIVCDGKLCEASEIIGFSHSIWPRLSGIMS